VVTVIVDFFFFFPCFLSLFWYWNRTYTYLLTYRRFFIECILVVAVIRTLSQRRVYATTITIAPPAHPRSFSFPFFFSFLCY
jgi:hypothetical protein